MDGVPGARASSTTTNRSSPSNAGRPCCRSASASRVSAIFGRRCRSSGTTCEPAGSLRSSPAAPAPRADWPRQAPVAGLRCRVDGRTYDAGDEVVRKYSAERRRARVRDRYDEGAVARRLMTINPKALRTSHSVSTSAPMRSASPRHQGSRAVRRFPSPTAAPARRPGRRACADPARELRSGCRPSRRGDAGHRPLRAGAGRLSARAASRDTVSTTPSANQGAGDRQAHTLAARRCPDEIVASYYAATTPARRRPSPAGHQGRRRTPARPARPTARSERARSEPKGGRLPSGRGGSRGAEGERVIDVERVPPSL